MKKLLVIAFMSLFAVSAFAVSMDFYGSTEFYGYMVRNRDANSDAKTASFYDQNFYLYGKAMIDPDAKASFNFRFKVDQLFGTNNAFGSMFDRVWLEYEFIDCLKLTLGRTNALRTKSTFARSFYNGNDTAGNNTKDLIKIVFVANDNVAIRAQTEKWRENELNATPDNRDQDLYLLGADVKIDSIGIYPVVTLLNDQQVKGRQIGAHLGVDYVPAHGFNAQAVFALSNLSGTDSSTPKYTVYGGMADLSYVAEKFKAGFIFAYGSEHKNSKTAFSYGKDWDKTKIIDAGVTGNWNASGGTPVSGAMAFYLYGDYKVIDSLTLGAVAALYTTPNKTYTLGMLGKNGDWNGDPTAFEVDLKAKYNFTKNTFASAGAGVAYATKRLVADNKKMDPVMVFWWGLQTNF